MEKLLSDGDPSPYLVTNADADYPVLITCEHAGGAIPRRLSRFGLSDDDFSRILNRAPHGDRHAGDLAGRIAALTGAALIESTYHRFIVDVNRGRSERFWFDSIEGIPLPVNASLAQVEIEQRAREIWDPYDLRTVELLKDLKRTHAHPFVLSVHTYNKTLKRDHEYLPDRPWQVGVLWDEPNSSVRVARLNRELGEFFSTFFERSHDTVGRNQPYDLSGPNPSTNQPWQTTVHRHMSPMEIPSVMLEIRNDQLQSSELRDSWATEIVTATGQALEVISRYR